MKKISFLMLTAIFLSQPIFAETCPSVENIKSSGFSGWTAYDTDDNKPLSAKRAQSFRAHIEQFALAQWLPEKRHRQTIRCFYRDKNGSQLETYLEKSNLVPERGQDYWYKVSGSMNCAAGMDRCQFHAPILKQTQLAKK